MTAEWRDAFINHRKPRWDLFTDTFIAASCNEAAMANPGWHPDLYATDLTVHLIGTSSASMWWILPVHEPSADPYGGDGACMHPHTFMARLTLCAATMAEPEVSAVPPSQIPSSNTSTSSAIPAPAASAAFATNPPPPPPPPRVGLLTRAMKSRAQAQMVEVPPAPTIVPTAGPSTTPYKLRRKEPEIATMQSPDVIVDSSADSTPKKTNKRSADVAELPDPQPELPFAIGNVFRYDKHHSRDRSHRFQDMCGPCIKSGQHECRARTGPDNRLTTACTFCNERKRSCGKPRPAWARQIFDAMQSGTYTIIFCYILFITATAPPSAGQGTHQPVMCTLPKHIYT